MEPCGVVLGAALHGSAAARLGCVPMYTCAVHLRSIILCVYALPALLQWSLREPSSPAIELRTAPISIIGE